MLNIGFHTGAFNSAYYSFQRAVEWAGKHGVHGIECGFVDGVTWQHGLGYFPHIASWEDPVQIAELLAEHDVVLSQIDAAFPISGKAGPSIALPYVLNTIRYAAQTGCPMVDTTDGLYQPEGLTDAAAMESMRRCYGEIVENATRYNIVINIETHGYFTSDPDRMAKMLDFVDSPLLQMTFDTGNVYIAGQDPVTFLQRHVKRVSHVHVKDVAPQLADLQRGKQTGIGMSHSAVGGGVNADNIEKCFAVLKENVFHGAVSLECDARGGPVMEESIRWIRSVLDGMDYLHDLEPEGGATYDG